MLIERIIDKKIFIVNIQTNRYILLKNSSAYYFWKKYRLLNFNIEKTINQLSDEITSISKIKIKKYFTNFIKPLLNSVINKKAYIDFSISSNIPIKVLFEITEKCNFKCVHCYCPRISKEKELNTTEIKKILDELQELGTIYITFTGGEPLLRKDFIDIYSYAKKKGFLIYIASNISLLNQSHIDIFKRYPPFNISISLYGSDNIIYENYTQTKIEFENISKKLELLHDNNISFTLKTPVSKINYSDLNNIRNIAKLYHSHFTVGTYIFPNLALKKIADIKCSVDTAVDIEKQDKDKIEKLKIQYQNKHLVKDKKMRCENGINAFAITCYGYVCICNLLRYKKYNLKTGNITESWIYIQSLRKEIDNYIENSDCVKCELKSICNWCPAYSLLENGVLDKKIKSFCKQSELRLNELKK